MCRAIFTAARELLVKSKIPYAIEVEDLAGSSVNSELTNYLRTRPSSQVQVGDLVPTTTSRPPYNIRKFKIQRNLTNNNGSSLTQAIFA